MNNYYIPTINNINESLFHTLGYTMFEGVDFEGTFFVHDDKDDDYVGFVFGFQDKSSFYTVVWKKKRQTYWMPEPFTAFGDEGLTVKVN